MTDLIRWDPYQRMLSLRDAIDRMVEEGLPRPFGGWPWLDVGTQSAAVDLYETDENLMVEASLPGFNPEQVDISIAGNTLIIKGEIKHEEEQEEKGKYHYRERRFSSFRRTLTLPIEVDENAAEAVFKNGVLKLTLPKVAAAKAKRIAIKAE
jgi:HSP20 family protein